MAVLINQGDRTVTDVIKGYGFIGVYRCSFFLRCIWSPRAIF